MKLGFRGLDGWKAGGYPVEPYTRSFHLDTGSWHSIGSKLKSILIFATHIRFFDCMSYPRRTSASRATHRASTNCR
jgi:hypothetical protein